MATRYTTKDGNIGLAGTWDGAADEQQIYTTGWQGDGTQHKFVYGANETECNGSVENIQTALNALVAGWSGKVTVEDAGEGALRVYWDSSLGNLNQLAGYYWDSVEETWENMAWSIEVEGAAGTLPASGDTIQIRCDNNMSSGTLSVANLQIFGEAGDPEGEPPTEDRVARLVVNGGSLTVTTNCDFGGQDDYSNGFSITSGSANLTWTGTLTGDSWSYNGTPRYGVITAQSGTLTLNGNLKGGAAGVYDPGEGNGDDSYGGGGAGVAVTGACTLTITGNCIGGPGSSGTYWAWNEDLQGEEEIPYTALGGGAVAGNGVATVAITGDCSVDATGTYSPGPAVGLASAASVSITGDAYTPYTDYPIIAVKSISTTNVFKGVFRGYVTGKITLTGAHTLSEGDTWFYDVRNGLTLDLTNLVLTNNGAFGLVANGGTVTVTGAAVTNSSGASCITAGATIPTVTWPEPDFPDAANVAPDDTTNGVTGTMDLPALDKVAPSDTLRGQAGTMDLPALANVSTADTLEGEAGTLDVAALEAAAAADQLVADVAAVTAAAGDIVDGVTILTVEGTFVVPTEAQVQLNVAYGAGGTEFTGELSGGASAADVAAAVWAAEHRTLTADGLDAISESGFATPEDIAALLAALQAYGDENWSAGAEVEGIAEQVWARAMGGDEATTAAGYLAMIRSAMALLPTSLRPTTYTNPAAATSNANITVIRGDDYGAATGDALSFVSEGWPNLQGATIRCTCRQSDDTLIWSVAGTVVTYGAGVAQEVKVELAHTATDQAPIGSHYYDVQATLGTGEIKTLVRGTCTVLKDYTRYPI